MTGDNWIFRTSKQGKKMRMRKHSRKHHVKGRTKPRSKDVGDKEFDRQDYNSGIF